MIFSSVVKQRLKREKSHTNPKYTALNGELTNKCLSDTLKGIWKLYSSKLVFEIQLDGRYNQSQRSYRFYSPDENS